MVESMASYLRNFNQGHKPTDKQIYQAQLREYLPDLEDNPKLRHLVKLISESNSRLTIGELKAFVDFVEYHIEKTRQ